MNKRSYIVLDLLRSARLGLNPTESILASFMYNLIARFEPIPVNGKWFYMADYAYISENCKMLPEKTDTLRRLYKRLENVGLIEIMKIGTHICFSPSDMLREWGTDYAAAEKNPGNECKSADAEKNPQITEKNPINAEKNPLPLYMYNIKDNIKDNSNNTTAQSKTLFRTCFPGIDNDDLSELKEAFSGKDYANIDVCYYFYAVADWSDQSNTKRTRRGWLATIRTFMRGDKEKGKLKTLTPQETAKGINVADAMDFLNDNY